MAATPTARDWDTQSSQTDSTIAAAAAAAVGAALSAPGLFLPPVGNAGGGGVGAGGSGSSPGAAIEYLRDLVQKRIIALTYTRNVHDGYVLPHTPPTFPLILILFFPSPPTSPSPIRALVLHLGMPDEHIGSILSW